MSKRGFEEIDEILEQNANRTNHLLAIAIDDYLHCPKLNNAVKDVNDFVELMTEKFEFEPENIRILKNVKATKSNVFKTLQRLAATLTSNDNLVLYFSGHGEYNKILKQGFWIPIEAERQDFSHYISNSDIKDYLSAIQTHHTFLIADSCFSGTLFSRGTKEVARRLEKNPSRWGLTSGRNEIVADGEIGKNSPFAASLLYHLRQATKPISVQRLCDFVLETTAANANQTPLGEPLQVKGHKSGQFVFRLKNDEKGIWQKVLEINTIEAYLEYEDNYPNSKHIKEIDTKINQIEEAEEWQAAKRFNKISKYRQYKRNYPKGSYFDLANEAIKALSKSEKIIIPIEKKVIISKVTFTENDPFKDQMIKVEGGTFMMGDDEWSYTKPIHKVTVPTFYISKYEVTQKQWQEIMGNNPSDFKGCDDCPVETVSWNDIQEFIKKLNQKTNQKYRLLSEAEWEYAARGGNQSKNYKYSGSNNIDEVAWYGENSSDKTHAVGTKVPNELGIYDMSGNVWEWCEDTWHGDYKNAPNDGSVWVDKDGDNSLNRVQRGGGYFYFADNCRATARVGNHPTYRYGGVGFRLGFQVQWKK